MTVGNHRENRFELLSRWANEHETFPIVIASRPEARIQTHECIRHLYEHLRELSSRPLDRLDLFLVGTGLGSELGVRAVTLLREYTRELHVVLTGTVGAGETLAAVGADALVMHPMAALTTALARLADGQASDGLSSIIARLAAPDLEDTPKLGELLRGGDPARLGDALHRVEWARNQIRNLVLRRVLPPTEERLEGLVMLLTRDVQSESEPIDRRRARASEALPVVLPTPDDEALLFDLHIAWEELLALLHRDPTAPHALIESLNGLHTLDVSQPGEAAENTPPRWVRHFDSAVH